MIFPSPLRWYNKFTTISKADPLKLQSPCFQDSLLESSVLFCSGFRYWLSALTVRLRHESVWSIRMECSKSALWCCLTTRTPSRRTRFHRKVCMWTSTTSVLQSKHKLAPKFIDPWQTDHNIDIDVWAIPGAHLMMALFRRQRNRTREKGGSENSWTKYPLGSPRNRPWVRGRQRWPSTFLNAQSQ